MHLPGLLRGHSVTRPLSACGRGFCFEQCDILEDLVLLLDDTAARAAAAEQGRRWARAFGLDDEEGLLFEVIAHSASLLHRRRAGDLILEALDRKATAAA